jgi:hypothetical protein
VAVHVGFAGWFQCRLSTDPDPYDEPRGVTGSTSALPGEPDLDRVIRFQPEGSTIRPGCERLAPGVRVDRVTFDGEHQAEHPLLGVPVRLDHQGGRPPVFEGRNSVVAGDAVEPIVPLAPRVGDGPATIGRAAEARYAFPFTRLRGRPGLTGLFATAFERATFVGAAAQVDIAAAWAERRDALEGMLADATPVEAAALRQRIGALQGNPVFGFGGVMAWALELRGPVEVGDAVAFPAPPMTDASWQWRLWMAGWDPDALCGYAVGALSVPTRPNERLDPPPDWWDRR